MSAVADVCTNGNRVAGCIECGWRGIPIRRAGYPSSCPHCAAVDVDREYAEMNTPALPIVGRNAPCPCGSGRKSKKCCA